MVCCGCPVRTECLSEALDNKIEFGVWGGMAERERRAILQALDETRGRLAETARRLGISRTTLWRRLKAYGLERHPDTPWRR